MQHDPCFKERERAEERLLGLSEELAFNSEARAVKELALWAAREMGLAPQERQDYCAALVALYVKEPERDALLRRIEQDLASKGLSISLHRLEKKLKAARAQACSGEQADREGPHDCK